MIYRILLSILLLSQPDAAVAELQSRADAQAVAEKHVRASGRVTQYTITDDGREHPYLLKLCSKDLEPIESVFNKLLADPGGHVFFFDVSTDCPGVVIMDADGSNYVAVDAETGRVFDLYGASYPGESWNSLLRERPLAVHTAAEAMEVSTIFLDAIGEAGHIAKTRGDVEKAARESFEHTVPNNCDGSGVASDEGNWIRGFEQLNLEHVGYWVEPSPSGFTVQVTTVHYADFVITDSSFNVPYVKLWHIQVGDKKFVADDQVVYPTQNKWKLHHASKCVYSVLRKQ